MSKKFKEPNIFKKINESQNNFLDFSDIEIDKKSVAILKSKDISPI